MYKVIYSKEEIINIFMNTTLTNEQEKDLEEQFYLNHFLSCSGIKIESNERGPKIDGNYYPDFIGILGSKKIGIELTNFHSLPKDGNICPREIEEAEKRINDYLMGHYKNDPKFLKIRGVISLIKENRLIYDWKNVAEEIINYIHGEDTLLKLNDTRSFPCKYPYLNKYVGRLSFYKDEGGLSLLDGGWAGLHRSELDTTLDKKLSKPRPDDLSEFWLLIVSGGNNSEQMGIITMQTFKGEDFKYINQRLEEQPIYDKVFIYQYMYNSVFMWEKEKGWSCIQKGLFGSFGK